MQLVAILLNSHNSETWNGNTIPHGVCVCVCVCVYYVLSFIINQHAPLHSNTTCYRVKYSQHVFYIYCSVHRNILWNNQQMRQCAVKFISLQVHSTCFGRHTRPSSGVQF